MFERFVAIGDSTTEGLDDPDGSGGYRGWANRLAESIAAAGSGRLLYANLAVRGRVAAQVRAEQLPAALALRPDLASVGAGLNDVLRPSFDVELVVVHVEEMLSALTAAGATVLTFTMPDLGSVMPLARPLRPRLVALNEALRGAARRTGALIVDLGDVPVAGDPRLWSQDRLHPSSAGHARIAAAFAQALQLPGSDGSWADPLPPLERRRPREVVMAEVSWAGMHLLPWVARRARGRSSGDGRLAKRAELAPLP